MIEDTEIGVFGELHPLVAERFDLTATAAPVLLAEFDLDALLGFVPEPPSSRKLPVTPPVLQDIALVVKQETPAAEVEAVIREAGGDLLKDVRLFDVYQGELDPGRAQEPRLQPDLPDRRAHAHRQEVAQVHARIVKAAERRLGAKLRA